MRGSRAGRGSSWGSVEEDFSVTSAARGVEDSGGESALVGSVEDSIGVSAGSGADSRGVSTGSAADSRGVSAGSAADSRGVADVSVADSWGVSEGSFADSRGVTEDSFGVSLLASVFPGTVSAVSMGVSPDVSMSTSPPDIRVLSLLLTCVNKDGHRVTSVFSAPNGDFTLNVDAVRVFLDAFPVPESLVSGLFPGFFSGRNPPFPNPLQRRPGDFSGWLHGSIFKIYNRNVSFFAGYFYNPIHFSNSKCHSK